MLPHPSWHNRRQPVYGFCGFCGFCGRLFSCPTKAALFSRCENRDFRKPEIALSRAFRGKTLSLLALLVPLAPSHAEGSGVEGSQVEASKGAASNGNCRTSLLSF